MKSDFRLVGLSRPRSMTLEFLHTDKETFWAVPEMPQDRFDALFNWAKSDDNFWKNKWVAEVEHSGFYEDGTPAEPKKVVAIRECDY
jgi:hypothetical protein